MFFSLVKVCRQRWYLQEQLRMLENRDALANTTPFSSSSIHTGYLASALVLASFIELPLASYFE